MSYIGIEKCGARAPGLIADAARGTDIGKGTVAVVAVEHVAAEVHDVDVRIAVIVIVGCHRAHTVARVANVGG